MRNNFSFLPKLFCLIYTFLCINNLAHSRETIIIDSVSKKITGKNLSIYIPKEEERFNQVVNEKFHSVQQITPNLGIQNHSIWLKFSVLNNSFASTLLLNIGNNTISEAVLYFKDPNVAGYDSIDISNLKPLNIRKYKGSDIIFRIDRINNLQQNRLPQEYYLKIKSKQPIVLPINLNLPGDQLTQTVIKNWINGIYFGMILIMSIYNFFLFLSIRESSYIYYVAFILTSGLTQLCLKGIAFQYFWPNTPFLEGYSMVFLASLSGIFGLLFTIVFLRVKRLSKIWYKGVLILTLPFITSILLLILGYFDYAFKIMRSATGISAIIVIILAIYVLKRKRRGYAIYFLVSWFFLILGGIIFILKDIDILPYNFFTDYSVQIFSAIEMTLLSFALANRINVLKQEKELSRLTTLKLAQENEQIVKRQNILLESKVEERTAELNHTLGGLKRAQAKLVSSEKMSSLGQLTAGIAHEINNPINFVAANVKPLKRDVFQLFEIINKIEEIYAQDHSIEEMHNRFELYKEEMDFPFLKTEIIQLLKGIKDGASRTADIVKGLRAFSRHDDGEFVVADINAGLISTLTISNNLLNEITLIKELGEIPFIECNPGRLNQVFLNLITNAIFAIREKFGNLEGGQIYVKTYFKHEFVFISIKDNGIGMDKETKLKLFDPFFTTKPVGEGTGLGMSIAFNFIQQHQGKLIVNSERGIGTEILLRLFIAPPPTINH